MIARVDAGRVIGRGRLLTSSAMSIRDQILRTLLDEGRSAWPAIPLDPELFVRHADARLPAGDALTGRPPFVPPAADLFLACACAHGLPEAIACFDRDYLGRVASFTASVDRRKELADEVCQLLRVRLLVPRDGGLAKIGDYTGRGPLAAWVRVVALRIALEIARPRREAPHAGHDLADAALIDRVDPEGSLIRSRYQADFQEALEAALAALTPRERNMLRFYFAEDCSIDDLGSRFGVHRATAARQVKAAEKKLHDETRRLLGERLGLAPPELSSLVRLLQSGLELSFSQLATK